jgi:hypothetical protein
VIDKKATVLCNSKNATANACGDKTNSGTNHHAGIKTPKSFPPVDPK